MSIQIAGTTVVDNDRKLQNIEGFYGNGIASQIEAEAGTNTFKLMTPERVKQAIAALGGSSSVINSIQRGKTVVPYNGTTFTITSVDMSKSFVSAHFAGAKFTSTTNNQTTNQTKVGPQVSNADWQYGYGYGYGFGYGQGWNGSAVVQLTSSTELTFTVQAIDGTSNVGEMSWEVIEFV